jgi:membrane-associated PAP2 superfamily phosphatase
MKQSTIVHISIISLALILGTVVIAWFGWDLPLARSFYVPGQGFPIGLQQPWHTLYRFGEWPAFLLGGAAGIVFLLGFFRPSLAVFRRQALFLALLLIIAPGILANAVFKDHWGRPRPRQVIEMGGSFAFHQPWQPGPAPRNASFPAGHPTVAFYLSAPYFVLRRTNRRKALYWLWGGLVYGCIMGMARIIQGGHFLSDVLWSAGFVYLTALVLADLLQLDDQEPVGSACVEE